MSDELSLWWESLGCSLFVLLRWDSCLCAPIYFDFFFFLYHLAFWGLLVLMKSRMANMHLLSTARMCRRKFSHWCQGGHDVKNIHENKRGIRKIAPLDGHFTSNFGLK